MSFWNGSICRNTGVVNAQVDSNNGHLKEEVIFDVFVHELGKVMFEASFPDLRCCKPLLLDSQQVTPWVPNMTTTTLNATPMAGKTSSWRETQEGSSPTKSLTGAAQENLCIYFFKLFTPALFGFGEQFQLNKVSIPANPTWQALCLLKPGDWEEFGQVKMLERETGLQEKHAETAQCHQWFK